MGGVYRIHFFLIFTRPLSLPDSTHSLYFFLLSRDHTALNLF